MFTIVFGLVALTLPAVARIVTVDNVSPRVMFSPTPCFRINVTGCSDEWLVHDKKGTFNGSVALTSGDPSQPNTSLPKASLTFQGSNIVFHPGKNSTALAVIAVDDVPPVLVDTQSAFTHVGLDPTLNHTISITFIPSDNFTSLHIDYFEYLAPGEVPSSTASPTSTLMPPPSAASSTTQAPPIPTTSQPAIPIGTIAAVSLSGAIVLVLGLLVCFCAARRRRRHDAVRRERAILYDVQLPSERESRYSAYVGTREKGWELDGHYRDMMKEKSKKRKADPPELEWRIATPPESLRGGRKNRRSYSPWS